MITALKSIKPNIRRLKEMTDIVYDREWLKKADPETELYYVWRDIAENDQDRKKIARLGLRYDITQFAPLTLGIEFNKTFGHTHSPVPGSGLSYTEIYEVLEGEVCFLFQKFNREKSQQDKIEDIFAVRCLAGDKYIIPPGYAHISVNPTEKKTVLANWLAVASQQDYQEIKEMKGAGYYAIKPASRRGESQRDKSENGLNINWIKNQNYSSVPKLRFVQPNNLSQFGISQDQPMYHLVNSLEKLDFLKNPQNYLWN